MKYIKLITLFFILFSCTRSREHSERIDKEEKINEQQVIDTILINTHFPELGKRKPIKPINEKYSKILAKFGICYQMTDKEEPLLDRLPCGETFFKVVDASEHQTDSLIAIVVRPGIKSNGYRLMVLANKSEEGFKLINEYKGELLEMRTQPGKNHQLLIRYVDSSIGTVGVLHQWDLKQQKYIPKEVQEINDYFVKEEVKDSLNSIYLTDFVWGY